MYVLWWHFWIYSYTIFFTKFPNHPQCNSSSVSAQSWYIIQCRTSPPLLPELDSQLRLREQILPHQAANNFCWILVWFKVSNQLTQANAQEGQWPGTQIWGQAVLKRKAQSFRCATMSAPLAHLTLCWNRLTATQESTLSFPQAYIPHTNGGWYPVNRNVPEWRTSWLHNYWHSCPSFQTS